MQINFFEHFLNKLVKKLGRQVAFQYLSGSTPGLKHSVSQNPFWNIQNNVQLGSRKIRQLLPLKPTEPISLPCYPKVPWGQERGANRRRVPGARFHSRRLPRRFPRRLSRRQPRRPQAGLLKLPLAKPWRSTPFYGHHLFVVFFVLFKKNLFEI